MNSLPFYLSPLIGILEIIIMVPARIYLNILFSIGVVLYLLCVLHHLSHILTNRSKQVNYVFVWCPLKCQALRKPLGGGGRELFAPLSGSRDPRSVLMKELKTK